MKIITNGFKEEIAKLGREIDFKINLHINDRIITQDNKFIITQDNLKLVVEQFNEDDIDETIGAEDIYNAVIVNKGSLLSTLMKEFDFEISEELRLGDIVDCSFGLKVGDEYEYVNYGKYIIYSKEKNEDTNTYSYVAFDSMLLSMVEVDDTSIIQNVTVQQAIENICDKVGLTVNITAGDVQNYPNLEKVINENAFTNIEMTYRDVLDMICQCLGLSMIVDSKELKLKPLNHNVVDSFDEEYLKDTNVRFNEKYMINSVVLSRSEDTDNIYRQDEESVAIDGVHEYKIKDNLIMIYDDREDYIDEIFEQLNGTEFYINDFESTGITYLDWLDFYNINVGDKTYKCLMLNDEIKVQQGLEESIYTDMPKETVTNYKTSSKTDKEVSFIVDKQNGEIKSRVTQGELESTIEQTASSIGLSVEQFKDGEKVSGATILTQINNDESETQINADKISLAGKTIQMTSDNIAINSTNFKVDKNGNITALSGTFGGTINTSQDLTVGNNAYIGQNQSSSIIDQKFIYFSNNTYIKRNKQFSTEVLTFKAPISLIYGGNTKIQLIENQIDFEYNNNNTSYTLGTIRPSYFEMTTLYDGNSNYSTIYGDQNSINMVTHNSNGNNRAGIYVNSKIEMTHNPTIISDKRLKNKIKNIKVDWIDKLKVKEFEYNSTPNKKQIGLIAQDYIDEDFAKYFINEDDNGYYSVCYGNITNALIQYCQEMKKEINSLKEEIKKLKESDK